MTERDITDEATIRDALEHRCPQCSAVPRQHCRPYDRNRIVHPNRGKSAR